MSGVGSHLNDVGSAGNLESMVSSVVQLELSMARFLSSIVDDDGLPRKVRMDASKALMSITKHIADISFKKRDMEAKDEVDFHHPKIEKGYYFLMEVVLDSMRQCGIDTGRINQFVTIMGERLLGFEDRLNKELKTLSGNMVNRASNPLILKSLGKDVVEGESSE